MNDSARNRILAGTSHVLEDRHIELLLERMYYDAQLLADVAKQDWNPEDPFSPAFFGDFGYSLRPALGEFIYIMARATEARLAVCTPVSAGAPLLYLGAAVRDNGGGRVVGVEPRAEFGASARQTVTDAGLDEFVEIRFGDPAIELANCGGAVDIAVIDGWPEISAPSRARQILHTLTAQLRPGALLVNDSLEPDYLEAIAQMGYPSVQTDLGYLSVCSLPRR